MNIARLNLVVLALFGRFCVFFTLVLLLIRSFCFVFFRVVFFICSLFQAQLSTGSLRMKPRGSKKEIAVSFTPVKSAAHIEPDSDGNFPAVVYGTQGLRILTMDYDNRDTRRRRMSSM